jgi:hypothetical protein
MSGCDLTADELRDLRSRVKVLTVQLKRTLESVQSLQMTIDEATARHESEVASRPVEKLSTGIGRDDLGRTVRDAWVRWAEIQPHPNLSWLIPYDHLDESHKEADRQIGEAVLARVGAERVPRPTRAERTIRMTPVDVATDFQHSRGHREWRWQVDGRDPANGNAVDVLRGWGYEDRIAPEQFGELIADAVWQGIALIFDPIPQSARGDFPVEPPTVNNERI